MIQSGVIFLFTKANTKYTKSNAVSVRNTFLNLFELETTTHFHYDSYTQGVNS